MVIKPQDWDNLDESETGGNGITPGIYIVKIVGVRDVTEKQYLEIKFDIAKGEYENIFSRMSKNDLSKWSNQGIYRASYKETATVFFKRFITAVQKSNKNYLWDWDEQSLKNKFFVAVMCEEEYLNKEGELRLSVKLQSCRSLEALQKGEIKEPVLKKLKTNSTPTVVEVEDKDVPF